MRKKKYKARTSNYQPTCSSTCTLQSLSGWYKSIKSPTFRSGNMSLATRTSGRYLHDEMEKKERREKKNERRRRKREWVYLQMTDYCNRGGGGSWGSRDIFHNGVMLLNCLCDPDVRKGIWFKGEGEKRCYSALFWCSYTFSFGSYESWIHSGGRCIFPRSRHP